MRVIANLLILSGALWFACATQGSDSGARLSALEGRIQRLEEKLTEDASTRNESA